MEYSPATKIADGAIRGNMRVPGQTLLLASELSKTLHKFGFIFPKPPAETRIVCITTAANVYDEKPWVDNERQAFRAMGFALDNFDIAGQPYTAVADRLAEADVIYVTGGNTYYLMEQVNKSGFATALRTALARGALYIGSSAGAVIAGPRIDFIRTMDDAAAASTFDYKGLGPIDVLLLPHLDHPRAKSDKVAQPYRINLLYLHSVRAQRPLQGKRAVL